MNKRYKLLSLLICAGIVTSVFPSSGTGATSDSIAFYNSKKFILEMKGYDEVYDTNHDGVVNVFDVIRENKEAFQEESYTDLKSKIYTLETQIEILTQKLAEKEDRSQSESDLSEIYSALSGKVDQQDGKQLSSNDYTNEEKLKLENLNNYDDTSIKSDISGISSELSGKVDNIEGKQLSSNDYTNEEKIKLDSLENYDDTKINEKIDSLVQTAYEEKKEIESSIENKVDKEEGKQLSSNDYTDEEKQKLDSLSIISDDDIPTSIFVDKNGKGDYSSLTQAINFAISKPNTTVIVNDGEYNLIDEFKNEYGKDFFDNPTNSGLVLENGINLVFSSNSKVTFNYTGNNTNILSVFSPFNIHGNCNIKNLSIEASRCRYCVHDDLGDTTNQYHVMYDNCNFYFDNRNNEAWSYKQCIGGGLGFNGETIIQNCTFNSIKSESDEWVASVTYHNDWSYSASGKCRLIIKDNYFEDYNGISLRYHGATTKISEILVSNNSIYHAIEIRPETITDTNVNIDVKQWNNEIRH